VMKNLGSSWRNPNMQQGQCPGDLINKLRTANANFQFILASASKNITKIISCHL
jgi:hypothetical protein